MLGPFLGLPKLLLGRPRCGDGVGCFTSGRGYSRLTFGNGTVDDLLGFERNSSSLPTCLLGVLPRSCYLAPGLFCDLGGSVLCLGGTLPGGGDLTFGRCGDLCGNLLCFRSALLQLHGDVGVNADHSNLL